MFNHSSIALNDGRLEIEGAFNVSSAGAVLTQTNGDGSTFTVVGQGMSVTKTGTGAYTVVVATANFAQGPIFDPVQILNADASFIAATFGGATSAFVTGVTVDATGHLNIAVLLTTSAGAAADTTVATTVTFSCTLCYRRMASPL